MAISKIPSAGFQDNVKFRNIIINGDMSIAQRGTSQTGLGNADNGYHTCDRWKFQETGSPTGVFTQSQSTDVPSGQGFATSLKMDCTTADTSLASDDWLKIEHKIEGQNIQYLKYGTSSAQSLTLSFWVKSSKTGTYGVGLFQTGDNRHIESNYTINSADTWEKKIITYSGDTNTAPDNDNTEELRLWFTLLAGTGVSGGTQPTSWSSYNVLNVAPTNQVNLSDSTSNDWYITGVQLEAGTTASDFEFLPHDANLHRCHRYCNATLNYGDGNTAANRHYTGAHATHGYIQTDITTMRATPSVTYSVHGGSITHNYSSPSKIVLVAINDTSVMAYDLIAEAEL
tara:strand:+ start:1317 stop:2342 length:1026 start_codon:yes stop_codon:yes gene_type:complete